MQKYNYIMLRTSTAINSTLSSLSTAYIAQQQQDEMRKPRQSIAKYSSRKRATTTSAQYNTHILSTAVAREDRLCNRAKPSMVGI